MHTFFRISLNSSSKIKIRKEKEIKHLDYNIGKLVIHIYRAFFVV